MGQVVAMLSSASVSGNSVRDNKQLDQFISLK